MLETWLLWSGTRFNMVYASNSLLVDYLEFDNKVITHPSAAV